MPSLTHTHPSHVLARDSLDSPRQRGEGEQLVRGGLANEQSVRVREEEEERARHVAVTGERLATKPSAEAAAAANAEARTVATSLTGDSGGSQVQPCGDAWCKRQKRCFASLQHQPPQQASAGASPGAQDTYSTPSALTLSHGHAGARSCFALARTVSQAHVSALASRIRRQTPSPPALKPRIYT